VSEEKKCYFCGKPATAEIESEDGEKIYLCDDHMKQLLRELAAAFSALKSSK